MVGKSNWVTVKLFGPDQSLLFFAAPGGTWLTLKPLMATLSVMKRYLINLPFQT
jgi:hypothetical protein